jgi:hypothetical protein
MTVCVLGLVARMLKERGMLCGSSRLCEYGRGLLLWVLRGLKLGYVEWVGRRE